LQLLFHNNSVISVRRTTLQEEPHKVIDCPTNEYR
jgi:hypothetical protein